MLSEKYWISHAYMLRTLSFSK